MFRILCKAVRPSNRPVSLSLAPKPSIRFMSSYGRMSLSQLETTAQNLMNADTTKQDLHIFINSLKQRKEFPQLSGTATSSLLWCMANNRHTDAVFLDLVSTHVQSINDMTPQTCSTVLSTFAILGHKNDVLFKSIASKIIDDKILKACTSSEMTLILWAFAKVGIYAAPVFMKASRIMLTGGFLHTFSPTDLSTTLKAYAKLHIVDEPLFTEASRVVGSGVEGYCVRDIAGVVWAYHEVGIRDTMLFESAVAFVRSCSEFSGMEDEALIDLLLKKGSADQGDE